MTRATARRSLVAAALALGALLAAPPALAGEQDCFDQAYYLESNPDVAAGVASGVISSAERHYQINGKAEGRIACSASRIIPAPPLAVRIVLAAALLLALLYLAVRRAWGPVRLAVGVALVVAQFAYFDYLIARKSFIFRDIAADSVDQFWPMMVLYAKTIWSGQVPMWSFEVGVGQNVFPGWLADPFALFGILLGRTALPYAIGAMQVAKILVAAGCAAAYFRLLGYGRAAAVIGALSLAFCGHMVSRGTWYEYGTEVALVAFYLFAQERFVRSGRFVLLGLATGLLGFAGTYHAFLWGVLMALVACVRILFLGGGLFARPRAVLLGYAGVSAAGVALAGLTLLPDVFVTLSSTRVSGEAEVFSGTMSTPFTEVERASMLLTALARALSPNLLGDAASFSGDGNYLEAPLPYAGLLALLLAAPCVAACSRRQRVVVGVFFAAVLAYHFSVLFRLAMNAFAGHYYKISNLWIPVGLALCAAKAVDGMERSGRVPWKTFSASLVGVVAALATVDFLAPRYGFTPWRHALWLALILAFGYGLVLLAGDLAQRVPARLAALAGVLVLELTATSYDSIGRHRRALDGLFPEKSAGYTDADRTLIDKVRAADPGLYRIERESLSASRMDALIQDYLGTKAYLSFTSAPYVDFLKGFQLLDLSRPRPESYLDGLGPRAFVLPIFGVKYYLAHGGPRPAGFATEHALGERTMLRNDRAGSLGHFYPRAIAREELAKLETPLERQAVLLHAAVVEALPADVEPIGADGVRARIAPLLPGCRDREECIAPEPLLAALAEYDDGAVAITRFAGNRVDGTVTASRRGVLFLSVPADKGWRLEIDGERAEILRVHLGFVGAVVDPGTHTFRLRYRAPGAAAGALATMGGALCLGAAAVVARVRRRRAAASG